MVDTFHKAFARRQTLLELGDRLAALGLRHRQRLRCVESLGESCPEGGCAWCRNLNDQLRRGRRAYDDACRQLDAIWDRVSHQVPPQPAPGYAQLVTMPLEDFDRTIARRRNEMEAAE